MPRPERARYHPVRPHSVTSPTPIKKTASQRRTRAKSDERSATRDRLLDAAEGLFATRGADAISVRQITDAARANLGAVNYHFGCREKLLMAVFSRRLKEVNTARIARLDALERQAAGQPLGIREIMDAFIRPAMEGPDEGLGHSEAMTRLISRSHCEQSPALKKLVEEQFEEVVTRFDASLLRAAEGITPTDIHWRMVYLVGALNLAQDRWLRFDGKPFPGHKKADGTTDVLRPDRETFIREIVDFCTAGFCPFRPGAGGGRK